MTPKMRTSSLSTCQTDDLLPQSSTLFNARHKPTFLAYIQDMNWLFAIIIIIAIILAIVGGFIEAVNFLLWVGLILLILAVIAWLIRSLTGRNR